MSAFNAFNLARDNLPLRMEGGHYTHSVILLVKVFVPVFGTPSSQFLTLSFFHSYPALPPFSRASSLLRSTIGPQMITGPHMKLEREIANSLEAWSANLHMTEARLLAHRQEPRHVRRSGK